MRRTNKQAKKKQDITNHFLSNLEKGKKRPGVLKPVKEFVRIENAYKAKEEKKARKILKADNFDIKVLLGESSDDADDEDNYSQSDSVKEIKRVLNSLDRENYEERHHKMMTELRIRKILAREKIKYPTREVFDSRQKELRELYSTFSGAMIKNQ